MDIKKSTFSRAFSQNDNIGCKFIFLLLAAVGVGMYCYLIYYMFSNAFNGPFIEALGIVVGVCLLMPLILISTLLLLAKSIKLHEDRIVFISRNGKVKRVIYFNDVLSWAEIESGGAANKLLLNTKNGVVKIYSNKKGYKQIKNIMTQSKTRAPKPSILKYFICYRHGYISILIVVISWIGLFWYKYNSDKNRNPKIVTIENMIISDIDFSYGGKGRPSVRIKINSFPKFNFNIDGLTCLETNIEELKLNIRAGNSVTVDIDSSDYQMLLAASGSLGFWERVKYSPNIGVLGLRDHTTIYLVERDISERFSNQKLALLWSLFIFGFIFFILTTVQFSKFKKKYEQLE